MKKLIAKLFFQLTDWKNVKFKNLYSDSKNIYELFINNGEFIFEIDSLYQFETYDNYIDDCLESTSIYPQFFEINKIISVYHESIDEELILTKNQLKELRELLEKAVKYKLGIKINHYLTSEEELADLQYQQSKDEKLC